MTTQLKASKPDQDRTDGRKSRRRLRRLFEYRLMEKVSFSDYQDKVRRVYAGPKGALLSISSLVSLHSPLGNRLFRKRIFDLKGVKNLLDIGSGAGQILRHVVRYADPDTRITGIDLSLEMLRRARRRIPDDRVNLMVADLAKLPFADATFDCVTCGYVLEYMPEASWGLSEMARVMAPGGRLLLLASEDSVAGAMTSRLWRCRTYNREELAVACKDIGLKWHRELWFTPIHRLMRAGGIVVELIKR